jgi:DNA-binding IclR family transcriptional regulator
VNATKKLPKGGVKRRSVYNPSVPAVERASRVLLCLGESPSFKMKLTEICHQVGIHKSKGHSILNTLKQFGFVEKDPQTKTYSLGPALIFLSRHVLDNLHYPEIVAPFLDDLAKETNGTALFGLIYGEHLLVVGKREGNQNIGFTIRLGHRFHITLGAHGKAIVAFMPEPDKENLLTPVKGVTPSVKVT